MRWLRRNDQPINKRMLQISTKRVKDQTQLDRKGDPPGIVQEFKIWLYEQVVFAQPKICPGEEDEFWDTNGSYLGMTIRPGDSQQNKENLPNSGLCRPSRPLSKNKRKRKEILVPRPC